MIHPDLQPLAVPIESVSLDPSNPMEHPEESIRAIAASLRLYGQRKPIVVNRRTGVIEAGNGTYEAAKSLGWSEIAVLFVEDDPADETGYKIADNRTAQLARWNAEMVARLVKGVDDPYSIPGMTPAFLEHLFGFAVSPPAAGEVVELEYDEEEWGKTPQQAKVAYDLTNIRQIVLYYTLAEYQEVIGLVSALRDRLKTESTTEAVTKAIRGLYEDCCRGSA